MSLLLAVPISLDAFRDFAKQLRTCAQPLSVGFWYLEAARFVIEVCRPVSMVRMCLFAEALLTVVRIMRTGLACRRGVSQCTLSVAKAQNGVQVFLLCVKFNRNCHHRHFDLCCGVRVSFATHERQASLL